MSSKNTVLFATTKAEVMSFSILAKEKSRKTALDQHGCPAHCSVLTDITQDNQFVIGSEEVQATQFPSCHYVILLFYQQAVYFYQQDGRGPCLAFDGTKLQLHWFRGYLVIVGKDTQSLPRVAAGWVIIYDESSAFDHSTMVFQDRVESFSWNEYDHCLQYSE